MSTFDCPRCAQRIEVSEGCIAEQIMCRSCGVMVPIPIPEGQQPDTNPLARPAQPVPSVAIWPTRSRVLKSLIAAVCLTFLIHSFGPWRPWFREMGSRLTVADDRALEAQEQFFRFHRELQELSGKGLEGMQESARRYVEVQAKPDYQTNPARNPDALKRLLESADASVTRCQFIVEFLFALALVVVAAIIFSWLSGQPDSSPAAQMATSEKKEPT